MRAIVLGSILVLLLNVVATTAGASDQTAVDEATKAADRWLKLVDAGDYKQSWDTASSLLKNAVTGDQWAQQVGTARKPLGALVSRKLKSAQYATSLPGAPDGKYVVIQYESVFQNKSAAVETVTPMLDQDGQWRVSGYFIR
ncbi:MAG TPA: DUF4019 domain-containing protein [Pyrinomonadaceae bacterium]|nr:DUF4019 domain-containing protein [Pyrinomonadaceae bacterium]